MGKHIVCRSDQVHPEIRIAYPEIRISGRSISVLGERAGHMTMINQDRVKKVKDVELMERIVNLAKEI